MTHDASTERDRSPTAVLDLTRASGVWVVASSSPTRYFVDVRGLLLRNHGTGSPRFPYDDEWVPLVRVRSYDPATRESTASQIRCGARTYYLTDPRGGRWTTNGACSAWSTTSGSWRLVKWRRCTNTRPLLTCRFIPSGSPEAVCTGPPCPEAEPRSGAREAWGSWSRMVLGQAVFVPRPVWRARVSTGR
jgi:hypothetical protein